MPKELTHWILAEKALHGTEGSAAGAVIREHRKAYLAGAVLPDTLMHLFRGPHARIALDLAHRFHDPPHNSYRPLVAAAEAGPLPPPLLSCLLGVISHMQADIAIHPYVFALTGASGIGEHYRLETAIDTAFLRRGHVPPARLMKELVTPATRVVLVKALGMLFDPEGKLPPQALEQALDLHCRFQGMYDRMRWKVVAGVLGRICGPPLRNQRHLFYPMWGVGKDEPGPARWTHPASGKERTESVEELAEEAVRQTTELFRRIEAEGLVPALSAPPGKSLISGQ